jgi:leucyl aminopeptidase
MLEIAFVKPDALPRAGALVLLAAEVESAAAAAPPQGLGQRADEATGGAIGRALQAAGFKGRKGQSATVWAPGAGLTKVVAVGLSKAAELSPEAAEAAGATLLPAVSSDAEATVSAEHLPPALAVALAMGAVLRAYRFDRYRTKEKEEDKPKLQRLTVVTGEPDAARSAWAAQEAVAKGVYLARDLVTEPPNVLNPAEMAERCRQLEALGVEVEILGPKEMRKLGFGALLGVAQGSENEPRTVVMRWMGRSGGGGGKGRRNSEAAAAARPLAFLGKGVTFDTGGISIKPAQGMEEMKWDMAGAATVVGLMAALAGRKAKADVVGLVGLVENMPSGKAQRPGDVVKSYSGQTIEVINTDAEGRLVLADLLWYCQEKYDPRFMVDLATLTGAIIISLGHEHAGLFSNDDELAQRLLAAGLAVGEKCWRMPLGEAYDKQLKSDIADMKNVGGRPGGSITAAQFLQRFTNGKPWAHLDIAGTAWASKDQGSTPKGASGFGVRLLDRLVAEHYEG